jgi:hypothetical protein
MASRRAVVPKPVVPNLSYYRLIQLLDAIDLSADPGKDGVNETP